MNPEPTTRAEGEVPLKTWLDEAQERHAQAPREVAEGLLARAVTLPDDADGAEALRLAEHVMLAHLRDAGLLARMLAGTPATPALQPMRERVAWALATVRAGDAAAVAAASPVPLAARWRALQNVVLLWAQDGRAEAASAALRAPAVEALGHPEAEARKAYAACANNVASELRLRKVPLDQPRNAALDALMLEAAQLARRAWAAAGTWLHVERADYQLALCHAVVGQGAEALQHAQACLATCEAEGADAVERFFAHEAMAWALHASRQPAAVALQRAQMERLLETIGDEAMRAWCRETLQALPAATT
ncbi:hypothetical protein [Aquabacterium sp.]|uniref:hypothetical protein n=1 Tax=Aquabacterium sp. TaxID=1872578 RepID=UPI003784C6B0